MLKSIDYTQWFKAVQFSDMLALRMMIVAGVDLDMRDEHERTAFDIAVQNMDVDVMTTLLAARQIRFFEKLEKDSKKQARTFQSPSPGKAFRKTA